MATFLAGLGSYVLGALGFTSGGVVGGSIAAFVQGLIGNVGAGSLFAAAQSAGATGAAGYFGVAILGAGGLISGAIAALFTPLGWLANIITTAGSLGTGIVGWVGSIFSSFVFPTAAPAAGAAAGYLWSTLVGLAAFSGGAIGAAFNYFFGSGGNPTC